MVHMPPTKAPHKRQPRRDRIVAVALRMFSEFDYESVSMDELCRQAEVAKGLAFYHFGDKRGLFAAAAERAWQEMIVHQQPRPDEATASQRMKGYLRRHFEYVVQHPTRYRNMMSTVGSNVEVRDVIGTVERHAVSRIVVTLGCPANPPPRLRLAINGWAAFLDGVTLDWLDHRDTEIEDLVVVCVQSLVAAVRAAEGHIFDPGAELDALSQVSLDDGPDGESATGTAVRRATTASIDASTPKATRARLRAATAAAN
jgi:AcrR family transcriptional regulator